MPATMTGTPFTLLDEERSFLCKLLEQSLHDKQIEEHRTESIDFRKHVAHEVALLRGLIDKLKLAGPACEGGP